MTGLKFLFKNWTKWTWNIIMTAVFFAGIVFCGCYFEQDKEDYLLSKAFLQIAPYFVLEMATIVGFISVNGYKLIRSSPIAKELYTKSIPMFIIILSVASSVLANGIYFITLAVQGAPAAAYSDTLIFIAVSTGLNILCNTLLSRVMFGGLMGIYIYFLPYISIIMLLSENVKTNGFGLPVWTSALILLITIAVTSAIAFIISDIFFKKLNFKSQPAVYTK